MSPRFARGGARRAAPSPSSGPCSPTPCAPRCTRSGTTRERRARGRARAPRARAAGGIIPRGFIRRGHSAVPARPRTTTGRRGRRFRRARFFRLGFAAPPPASGGRAAGATVQALESAEASLREPRARRGPEATPDVETVVDMECAVAAALWAPARTARRCLLSARLEEGSHWVEGRPRRRRRRGDARVSRRARRLEEAASATRRTRTRTTPNPTGAWSASDVAALSGARARRSGRRRVGVWGGGRRLRRRSDSAPPRRHLGVGSRRFRGEGPRAPRRGDAPVRQGRPPRGRRGGREAALPAWERRRAFGDPRGRTRASPACTGRCTSSPGGHARLGAFAPTPRRPGPAAAARHVLPRPPRRQTVGARVGREGVDPPRTHGPEPRRHAEARPREPRGRASARGTRREAISRSRPRAAARGGARGRRRGVRADHRRRAEVGGGGRGERRRGRGVRGRGGGGGGGGGERGEEVRRAGGVLRRGEADARRRGVRANKKGRLVPDGVVVRVRRPVRSFRARSGAGIGIGLGLGRRRAAGALRRLRAPRVASNDVASANGGSNQGSVPGAPRAARGGERTLARDVPRGVRGGDAQGAGPRGRRRRGRVGRLVGGGRGLDDGAGAAGRTPSSSAVAAAPAGARTPLDDLAAANAAAGALGALQRSLRGSLSAGVNGGVPTICRAFFPSATTTANAETPRRKARGATGRGTATPSRRPLGRRGLAGAGSR